MIACASLFYACTDKNLYEPDPDPVDEPKSIDELFDFSTRTGVTLKINYGYPGYNAPFSVYAENPVESDGVTLKENIAPIYSAYTFEDNTFTAKVQIPSSLKKIYLYTHGFGLPVCAEVDIEGDVASYTNPVVTAETRSGTTSENGECINVGSSYTTVNTDFNIFALYNAYQIYTYHPSNTDVSNLYKKSELMKI